MYILIFNDGNYWELPYEHTVSSAIYLANAAPEHDRFEELEAEIIDEDQFDEDGQPVTVARFIRGAWEVVA